MPSGSRKDTMQFAALALLDGRKVTISADEYEALDPAKTVIDDVVDEQALRPCVAYGTLIPTGDLSLDDIRKSAIAFSGYAFGRVYGPPDNLRCRWTEVADLEFFAPVSRMGRQILPCAAYLKTIETIPEDEAAFTLPLFLRFTNQSVLADILGRHFILALRGRGPSGDQVSADSWRRHLNADRATDLSRRIG